MLGLIAAILLSTQSLAIDMPYYFNGTILVADDKHVYFHKAFGVADEDFQDPMTIDRQFCVKYTEDMESTFMPKTLVSNEEFPLLCPNYTELEDGTIVKNLPSQDPRVVITAKELHQWAQKCGHALDMRSFQSGFTCSLLYDPETELSIVVLENTLWESKDSNRSFELHNYVRNVAKESLTNLNK